MIRYLLRSVAVLTFVFGALFFILSWFDDAPPAMFTAKAAVSAIVMACSFILLFQVWVTQPHRWERELTLAVALISIMIGSAGAVWTVHLGLVTGDWEGYGFVVGGLILLQGVFAAVDALNAERPKQMA